MSLDPCYKIATLCKKSENTSVQHGRAGLFIIDRRAGHRVGRTIGE